MNRDEPHRGGGLVTGGGVATNGEAAIHGSVAKSGRIFTRVFDKRAVRLQTDCDLEHGAEAP